MKLKIFALISILSIGLLCACKSGDKPSSSENSSNQTSEVVTTSKDNPITSNGHNDSNTSYGTSVTSDNPPVSSSSSFTTSKDPSNPNFPLSNGEGEIVSWDDVGNI